ncbi:MAG: right-handed parallel beta-helix repeat-containing protein, partial [archaeon]
KIVKGSDNNVFTNNNFTVAHNALIIDSSTGNLFLDGTLSGKCDEVSKSDYQGSGTGTNTLRGVDLESNNITTEDSHKVYVEWYYRVRVRDNESTDLYNANVTVYNGSNAAILFSVLSATNGWIQQQNLTAFMMNATDTYYWTNFSLNFSKFGYTPVDKKLNLTANSITNGQQMDGPKARCGEQSTETWRGSVLITCDTTYTGAKTLTIAPGTNVTFDTRYVNDLDLTFGGGAKVLAQGSKTSFITFDSNNVTKAAGDYGDALALMVDSAGNIVEFTKISHASNGIEMEDDSVTATIQHNVFSDISTRAIYDPVGLTIKNNLFKHTPIGIYEYAPGATNYQYNTFYNMSTDAIYGTNTGGNNIVKNNIFAFCTDAIDDDGTGDWDIDYNVYLNNTNNVSGDTMGENNVSLLTQIFEGTGDNAWHLIQAVSPGPVDSGSETAATALLSSYTTSLTNATDSGTVDIGYHYPTVCSIPSGDDWNITTTCTYKDTDLIMPEDKDINILNSGELHLQGVNLTMDPSGDGNAKILVLSGGLINITNSTKINSTTTASEFVFIVRNGTTFNMQDSTLEECGYNTGDEQNGLEINTSSATINNNTFRNNFAGLHVFAHNTDIIGNKFLSNTRGIMISGANTNVTNNNFTSNSVFSITFATAVNNVLIERNNISQSAGTSLYTLGSNNQVKNCNIRHSGTSSIIINLSTSSPSTNTIIRNVTITSVGANVGITGGNRTLVRDTKLLGNYSSDFNQVYNLTALNVTFNDSNIGHASSHVWRKWYLSARVNSSTVAAISGATVTGWQRDASQEFTDTTDGSGWAYFNVTAYNQSGTSSRNPYTNYTINGSLTTSGYAAIQEEVNISSNTIVYLVLPPNAAPTLDDVNLTPYTPETGEDLKVNATCSDADGGDTITAYYNLWKDGANQTALAGSTEVTSGANTLLATIDSANTAEGEVWLASVRCTDNVTSTAWTNSSNVTVTDCAKTITTDYTLAADMNCHNTSLKVGADNITLDCDSYTITYATAGILGYGIDNTGGWDNITIQNCNIVEGNAATSSKYAIYFSGAENGTITNNNITVQGIASHGIYLNTASDSNTISYNNVSATGYNGHAIFLDSTSNSNNITNNFVKTTDSQGIYLYSSSSSNAITRNNIAVDGTSKHGIWLRSSSNSNVVDGNNVTTAGTGHAVYIDSSASSNNITNNKLSTTLTGDAIVLDSKSLNNLIKNNTVTASGDDGIVLTGTAPNVPENNTFINNTLSSITGNDLDIVDASIDYNQFTDQTILSYNIAGAGSILYFKNTGVGEVKFLEAISGSSSNLSDDIQINSNQIKVNSSGKSGLNASANLTLYGVTGITGNLAVRRNGALCPRTICGNFKNTSGVYSFNVTGFTNYSIGNNSVPTLGASDFTPTDANTSTDLKVNATCSDTDAGDTITAFYNLWKNGANQTALAGSTEVTSGANTLIATVDSSNTTSGEVWLASIRCDDGWNTSAWTNTTNITIENTPPGAPTLLSPTDNNRTIQNRTPYFNWTVASDDDPGDTIVYEINISSASGCNGDRNVTGIADANYTPESELCTSNEMAGGDYKWRVRAHDGTAHGAWSATWNFSIEPYVDITITQSTLNFGSMNLGEINDTTDDKPGPFKIRNDGNYGADLVNISSNGSLWASSLGALGTSYFQIKAGNSTEIGSFNWSTSTTTWANLTATNKTIIKQLNYSNAKDEAEIEVRLEVPGDEPTGSKVSWIIFVWDPTV